MNRPLLRSFGLFSRLRSTNRSSLTGLVAAFLLAVQFAFGNSQSAITNLLRKESFGQSSINAAYPGDTLVVPQGTYAGNLLIDKRLTLIGMDKPILRGSAKGSVITITSDSCIVKGFVIEHSGSMLVDEDAGILLKSHHNRVEENDLRDVLFGIYLLHAEHNIILNNHITGRRWLEFGERGSGIHIWNSRYNRFLGNVITDVRDGFYIQNASHSWIENNQSFNVRYGVHYMYADSNTFLNNSFYNNVAGAAIMYSRGIVMRNNVFAHNRGFSSFGILFQDCHELIADSNVITDNVVGMFFEASTDNTFRHNVVAQNDVALQMYQNSTNNTFAENNFVDNLNPLAIVGKRTESQWNASGRGNYWSSYDGYDLDGDGVGDIPMKIQNVFQYLEGQNANVRVYLYSPASQALAVAAKAFPIININEESDDHPLMQPLDMRALPAVRMMKHLDYAPINGNARSIQAWIVFPLVGFVVIGFIFVILSGAKNPTVIRFRKSEILHSAPLRSAPLRIESNQKESSMIQVEHLTKQYGKFTAVNDVTFTVKEGEVFAFLGPNGSGKTTTMKSVVGLNVPTSGRILINNLDVQRYPKETRLFTSYLPQRVVFPENQSAREIMQFYCRLRKLPIERADVALERARFNGFSDKLISEFSGGMVQRLGLAVISLPDAPILLLDEPTANLDPQGVKRFREFILNLKENGKTIIFSTHLLQEAEQLADRVGIFVGGKLVAEESIETLRKTYLASRTIEDMYLHYVGEGQDEA